jgi:hypothetical protein
VKGSKEKVDGVFSLLKRLANVRHMNLWNVIAVPLSPCLPTSAQSSCPLGQEVVKIVIVLLGLIVACHTPKVAKRALGRRNRGGGFVCPGA